MTEPTDRDPSFGSRRRVQANEDTSDDGSARAMNRRTALKSGAALAATGVLGGIAGCSGLLGGGGGSSGLSYGDEVEGQLGEDDEQNPDLETYSGYYDEYTFDGSEGDQVVIEMTSENGDTVLGLLGPDGETVATNDDDSDLGNLNSKIETELESGGSHTIVATSFGGSATFEYTLELQQG